MSETNTVRIDNLDSTNEQAQKHLILEMLRRGAFSHRSCNAIKPTRYRSHFSRFCSNVSLWCMASCYSE